MEMLSVPTWVFPLVKQTFVIGAEESPMSSTGVTEALAAAVQTGDTTTISFATQADKIIFGNCVEIGGDGSAIINDKIWTEIFVPLIAAARG